MKPVIFLGSALSALRSFPEGIRRRVGFQIDQVQRGLDPDNWKPMPTIGPGVRELRVLEATGAFRVVYVATFEEAVYVLHAFQKKTRTTSQRDIDLAKARFNDLSGGKGS
jgi:phage-related protein